MSTLHVQTGGRSYTFEEPRVVSIGRAPESDIVLGGAAASRRHAEIRWDGSGWTVVDVGSSSGTYLNGTRVTEVRVSGPTSVRFGSVDGEEMTLTVEGAAQQPAFPAPAPAAPAAAGPPVDLQQTVLPGRGPAPGAPGPYGAVAAGPGILVRIGNESKRFAAGTTVRLGRDPVSEVVIDDPSVSRLHATLEMRGRDWWYVDRSTAGTFHEEDRVTQRKLGDEPTVLMLGHPTAGAEVELVPIVAAGEAQRALASKKRKRTALVLTAIVAAVVLIVGGIGAVVLLGGGDDSSSNDTAGGPPDNEGLSAAALDRAKQATVLIIALDASGEVLGKGSGSIISDDGKILTVAHVGDPHAPGALFPDSDPAPAAFQIALTSPEDDKPADPEYTAEAVASDGPLDLTIMQITGDAEGNPIDPADLQLPEPLPIGDSDAVRTGDNVTALGFPGVAHVATTEGFTQNALTVTRGVVSTFLGDEPIDGERAWIDSDVRIGSGNSGGPSINDDGEIIGLNDNVVTEGTVGKTGAGGSFTGGSARIRPVNFAQGILDAADAGSTYTSPYLDSMEQMPTDVPSSATITAAGWSPDGKGNCQGTSSIDDPQVAPKSKVPPGSTIYAEYAVSGVQDGTPISVKFYAVDGTTELGSLEDRWSFGTDDTCITVPFTLATKLPGVIAEVTIGSLSTPNPLVFK